MVIYGLFSFEPSFQSQTPKEVSVRHPLFGPVKYQIEYGYAENSFVLSVRFPDQKTFDREKICFQTVSEIIQGWVDSQVEDWLVEDIDHIQCLGTQDDPPLGMVILDYPNSDSDSDK